MDSAQAAIHAELTIEVGTGATHCVGSDAYPYYVSEVLPKGIYGLYEPNSHFERDWAAGDMVVDKFDPSHKSELYVRFSYGHWWTCTREGKRASRFRISFGHAHSYRDPTF